ncbi:MAG: RNA polymerase sigma factor region1.1 domain-containing protein, partial [Endomicrobiia bacterium]
MAKKELFKDLILVGKKQGYLTYDEINKKIAEKDMTSDKIDGLFVQFAELGIKVVDKNASKKIKNTAETSDIVVKNHEDDEINPVRMYLTEMAKVPLLERNVEVE